MATMPKQQILPFKVNNAGRNESTKATKQSSHVFILLLAVENESVHFTPKKYRI